MPPKPISAPPTRPRRVNIGKRGQIPPYGGEQFMSPYRTDVSFAEAQLWDYERLMRYVGFPRRGCVSPAPWIMRDMEPRYALYHQASNRHARLLLAPLMLQALREGTADTTDIFLVSVTPRQYVLPVGEPDKTMLASLQFFSRQAIGNSSGIGIIEPALYVGCQADGPRLYGDVIAWHTHLIVWGVTLAELHRFREALGPQHVGITGRSCVWIKAITRDEAEIYARYMSKAPTSQYRLQRSRGEETDNETGEVFYGYRQNKEPLWRRPRRLVQLANVMKDLFMDDLVFGSGAGSALAHGIVDQIIAPRRREDEAAAAKRHRERVGFNRLQEQAFQARHRELKSRP